MSQHPLSHLIILFASCSPELEGYIQGQVRSTKWELEYHGQPILTLLLHHMYMEHL